MGHLDLYLEPYDLRLKIVSRSQDIKLSKKVLKVYKVKYFFQPAKEGKVEKKKAPAKKGGAKKGGAGKKKGGKKAAPKKATA